MKIEDNYLHGNTMTQHMLAYVLQLMKELEEISNRENCNDCPEILRLVGKLQIIELDDGYIGELFSDHDEDHVYWHFRPAADDAIRAQVINQAMCSSGKGWKSDLNWQRPVCLDEQ